MTKEKKKNKLLDIKEWVSGHPVSIMMVVAVIALLVMIVAVIYNEYNQP